jgi:hypothetical protein
MLMCMRGVAWGVTDFGPDRRSSFDRLRMSGYLFPLMVSLSNHGRDHVRVHPVA